MADNTNRDCAARLAAAGLVVFPCDPKKRTPLFEGLADAERQRRRHRRRLVDAMARRGAGARPGTLRPGGARRRSASPRRRRRRGAARAAAGSSPASTPGAADGEDAARRRARLLSAMPAGADQQPRQPAGRHRRARRRRLRHRARRHARQPAQLRADRGPARARRRVRRQEPFPRCRPASSTWSSRRSSARQRSATAQPPGQCARARLCQGRAAPDRHRARRRAARQPQRGAQQGRLRAGHHGGARLDLRAGGRGRAHRRDGAQRLPRRQGQQGDRRHAGVRAQGRHGQPARRPARAGHPARRLRQPRPEPHLFFPAVPRAVARRQRQRPAAQGRSDDRRRRAEGGVAERLARPAPLASSR